MILAQSRLTSQGAWVSHVVLVETSWVLGAVYERDSTNVASAFAMPLEHQALVVQEPEMVTPALARLDSVDKLKR